MELLEYRHFPNVHTKLEMESYITTFISLQLINVSQQLLIVVNLLLLCKYEW